MRDCVCLCVSVRECVCVCSRGFTPQSLCDDALFRDELEEGNFAQWWYRSQWGPIETWLLLVENYPNWLYKRLEYRRLVQFLLDRFFAFIAKPRYVPFDLPGELFLGFLISWPGLTSREAFQESLFVISDRFPITMAWHRSFNQQSLSTSLTRVVLECDDSRKEAGDMSIPSCLIVSVTFQNWWPGHW